MWVKTKKNGVIDWFASKKGHKVFYTKSNGTAIPSKVWTHVAGTFDTATGDMLLLNAQLGYISVLVTGISDSMN